MKKPLALVKWLGNHILLEIIIGVFTGLVISFILDGIKKISLGTNLLCFLVKPITIPMWLALLFGLIFIFTLIWYIIFIIKTRKKDFNDILKLF
jgi:hypothetical protein